MSQIVVNISDCRVAKSPDFLVTYALGSCVGICLYDPGLRIGALGHILLPAYPAQGAGENKMKYADTCIPLMVEQMQRLGSDRSRLTAKIAGGAQMFTVLGDSSFGNIGERNTRSVTQVLRMLNIPINAADIGLNYGRTVLFYPENGAMEVKSYAHDTKTL